MINQQLIKAVNKKKLYMLVSENPGVSRANLAATTELSKTTVSALVDELIQEGHLVDEGAVESKRQGRRPNSLAVNDKRDCVIVLNWRKRTIQTALVSAAYEVEVLEETGLAEGEALAGENPAEGDSSAEAPAVLIWNITREFLKNHGQNRNILGICLVIPGIVDSERRRIISMVLSLGEDDHMVTELRQQVKDYPLAVFNDTACLAYAENAFGDVDIKNYVYLNINEGVGASLIQNGVILRGATGMGTQFGHFSIDRDGELCSCGNRGCLENRIGEIVLARRAKECGALEEFAGIDRILFRHVGQLAMQGMPGAKRLISALADDLSYGLGNLITMFHPDTIIIGGMGRKLGELYLEQVIDKVKSVGFRQFVEDVDIRFTTLKEDAIFRGAAKYYMDTHYDFMEDMNGKLFLY